MFISRHRQQQSSRRLKRSPRRFQQTPSNLGAQSEAHHPWRGLFFGALGGVAAAWTMNGFQALLSRAASERATSQRASERFTSGQAAAARKSEEAPEDATARAAERIARGLHLHPLSPREKARAGALVHYGFGCAMGALYGLAAEYIPSARAGFGTLFGSLLFAVADEFAVPLAGLSGKPTEYAASSHLQALASHLVYGASTEAVRATLSRAA